MVMHLSIHQGGKEALASLIPAAAPIKQSMLPVCQTITGYLERYPLLREQQITKLCVS